jgi:hypothetical protein
VSKKGKTMTDMTVAVLSLTVAGFVASCSTSATEAREFFVSPDESLTFLY